MTDEEIIKVFFCPFHDERQPSLLVNTTDGLYQCRSCNAAGDTLTLLELFLRRALYLRGD